MDLFFFKNLFFNLEKTGPDGNRCKSKEAKDTGYNLLLSLIKALKPRELFEFLNNFLMPMI